jgi:hypothetical protein
VSVQRGCQLIDAQQVTRDDGECVVAAFDLVGRPDECGHPMTSGKGEVDNVRPGPAGRAEYEYSQVHDWKTGQPART